MDSQISKSELSLEVSQEMSINEAGSSTTTDNSFTTEDLRFAGISAGSDSDDIETLYDEDHYILTCQTNRGENFLNSRNISETENRNSVGIQDPENQEACDNIRKSRKRSKKAKLEIWERHKLKKSRQMGAECEGRKVILNELGKKSTIKIPKNARKIGERCSSKNCSATNTCQEFSDLDREQIFQNFWNLTWGEKKIYVATLIDQTEPTKRNKLTSLSKDKTMTYHLQLNMVRKRVCRSFFLSTLGIKKGQVYAWIRGQNILVGLDEPLSKNQVFQDSNEANSSSSRNDIISNSQETHKVKTKSDKREFLESFFNRLPKMPSHYTRADSTKSYLEPVFKTKEDVRKFYIKECTQSKITQLSRPVFDDVISDLNIGLFRPKNDQCDECLTFEKGQKSPEAILKHQLHLKRKAESRASKDSDKAKAIKNQCFTLCVDVQQVKLAHALKASSSYFKQKIASHNYSVFNLATKHTMCYWWNETQGGLDASVFSSCIIDYLTRFCLSNGLPIIIYSDGCTSQNRNAIISSALSHFSVSNKVEIFQKFLEKGHTQMEVDSVHSSIEAKLKGKEVSVPSEYLEVTKMARKIPYESKELNFDFFNNYKETPAMQYMDIRPGKSSGDPVVTNLRVIKYTPDGKIYFKLNCTDDFKELPNKRKEPISLPSSFPKMYAAPLKITKRKYKDLQDLKPLLSEKYRKFYDDLLHE